jgi:hypothetical protein
MPTGNYRQHRAPFVLTDVTTQRARHSQKTQLLSLQLPFSVTNEIHDTESLLRNQHALRRVRNSHLMRTEVSSPSSQRPKLRG